MNLTNTLGMFQGINWAVFAGAAFGLACFGVMYNLLVDRMGDRKFGYVAFLVVLGVLITLGAAALVVPIVYVLIIVLLFGVSGLPMIVGDVLRAVRARETDVKRQAEEAKHWAALTAEDKHGN